MLVLLVVLVVLGALIAVAGLTLIASSLLSAHRRGQAIAGRFWAPAETFVGNELSRNRRGFWLCVAGIFIQSAAMYLLWPY